METVDQAVSLIIRAMRKRIQEQGCCAMQGRLFPLLQVIAAVRVGIL